MLEEDKIIFNVLLTAPASAKVLISVVDKWANQTKLSANKIKKSIFNAIKTTKDFDKKITQPTLKTIDAFYKDGLIFKGGISKEKMLANTKGKTKKAARQYLKNIKQTFKEEDGIQAKRFQESVDDGKMNYARSQLEYNYPLFGSKEKGVKGLTSLGVMAFSGDESLKKFLKLGYDNITKITGGKLLCITSLEHLVKFKRELRSAIARLGREIMRSRYAPDTVKSVNEKINRLVDGYRLAEFAPFKPGGASHIDFIVRELVDPANPHRNKKRLALDIQVSGLEHYY
jgi:hypothetical protein